MTGTPITLIGSLGQDPELRQTQSGRQVASTSLAFTPRVKVGDSWEDGETMWFRLSIWEDLALHVTQSLHKGDRVFVQGRLSQQSYQAQSGENRTSLEVTVDEIGPTLRFATTVVTKVPRPQQGQQQPQQWQQGQQPQQQDPRLAQPVQAPPQQYPQQQNYQPSGQY